MDHAAWKLFIDAVELGSLSKVAVAYGTSQPHVSRQISELEQECGGRLFQRTGRGVVLTELGQRVAPKVRAWLASTEQLENGNVDLAILYRYSATPKDGDIYLEETATYLVGASGDALTAQPTVPFSALHHLPLVMFCRPNSWRDYLDQLCHEQGVALNIAVEADSLALQTHIVADGCVYALLGPYAVAVAARECRLQAARLVDPVVTRHIALAMTRHGELTLACKTVMQVTQEIVRTGAVGPPAS